MNRLSKLSLTSKQLFVAVSVALFLMLGLLLSPLVPARLFGTPVSISYQSSYIEKEMTVYPTLSIETIPKDRFPAIIDSLFYLSTTEQEAYDKLSDLEPLYLVVAPVNGVLQIQDVVTTQPSDNLYLMAELVYFEYDRMNLTTSSVWQDNFSGIRFVISNRLNFYAPRTLSQTMRQDILDGTATFDAYLWNGQLYFIDFNL
jgi:hypothetical protein